MAYVKRIVCLAASRKTGGYCYAGIEPTTGAWVRPVSPRQDHEISALEALHQGNRRSELLDILDIPFSQFEPIGFQSENHVIDVAKRWGKVGKANWHDVLSMVQNDAYLWGTGDWSGGYGNNRVAAATAFTFGHSLALIRPERLTVSVGRKGGIFEDADRRLVKAHFRHGGNDYTLSVTDPSIENRLRAGADRTEDFAGAAICVSLALPYKGHAYKLVAAIIEPF